MAVVKSTTTILNWLLDVRLTVPSWVPVAINYVPWGIDPEVHFWYHNSRFAAKFEGEDLKLVILDNNEDIDWEVELTRKAQLEGMWELYRDAVLNA